VTLPSGNLPSKPPKAVIFDIGRVIVRLNLKRAFAHLASHTVAPDALIEIPEQSHDRIWTAIQADPRWRDWQEGRMTPQAWHEHITRQLRVTTTFEEFRSTWNSLLEPETILSEGFFEQLSRHVRLGLLSNTDPIHVEHLETRFPFVRHFEARIYSNEVGITKPSPAIYHAALAALNVSPADALYIDDIAEYAGAARQLGLDAIHFEDAAQLATEFALRGLPLPV
jgi:HAD superfamily hydrolase (TIGR01549 family)